MEIGDIFEIKKSEQLIFLLVNIPKRKNVENTNAKRPKKRTSE